MLTNPISPTKHKVNDLSQQNLLYSKESKNKAPQVTCNSTVYQQMIHLLPLHNSYSKNLHEEYIFNYMKEKKKKYINERKLKMILIIMVIIKWKCSCRTLLRIYFQDFSYHSIFYLSKKYKLKINSSPINSSTNKQIRVQNLKIQLHILLTSRLLS